MQDFAGVTVAGIDNTGAPRGPAHRTRIAGLAAAERVEHGAVDGHGAVCDSNDLGVTFLQIGVFAEEFVGHALASL